MATRRATPPALVVPRLALALLVLIAFGWGLNWPAMKVALYELPPITFRALCAAIAGSMLLGIARAGGNSIRLSPHAVPTLALIALFSVVSWQLFSAFGLLYVGSGKASIIAFTMPLWATLLSILLLGERIGLRQITALALGMAALVLLIGEDLRAVGASPLGGLLMVAAAFSWATGTVIVKKTGWLDLPVTAFTGWQLLIGGIPLAVAAILLEPMPDVLAISALTWFCLLFAAIIGLVFCVTAYFRLVRLVPASIAATGTLAVPVVGVVSSAILLGETIGFAEAGALVLVVSSLGLLVFKRS